MIDKKPFHETVAEKLIKQLEAGTAPWQRPWEPGEPNAYLPMNPTTGKRYKGINAVYLMAQGRNDERWMTYKQAADVGAQVRKGERGTPVQYWKFSEQQDKLDDQGKPVTVTVMLERPRVFFAVVFNAEQIDGLPPIQPKTNQSWNANERSEHILKASGAKITHASSDRAFYRSSTDTIAMPERGQFQTADQYYATALHELGHWTGHPSRLNRDLSHPFGSEGYAKEELRAEIASMILGDELGIGHDPGQHAAYVGSWIKALQNDPLEIFRAASDAEKIHKYVVSLEQLQEHRQESVMSPYPDVASLTTAQKRDLETAVTVYQQTVGSYDWPSGQSVRLRTGKALETLGLVENRRSTANAYDHWAPTPRGLEVAALAAKDIQSQDANASELDDGRKLPGLSRGEGIPLGNKTFIDVPFKEKEQAKALGAKWDRQEQSWYVPANLDPVAFAKWFRDPVTDERQGVRVAPDPETARQYLAVPYGEREAAKAAGALWDKAAKSWYAGPQADMAKLERWEPENVQAQQGPAMTPEQEFTDALKSMGCVVAGEHPIMDGKKHRIETMGDKTGEKAGFYVGHLDGHPAGFIKNNRTGVEMRWKSKGYSLDPQQKAALQAEAAAKGAARAKQRAEEQERAAQRIGNQIADLIPITTPTPYLEAKGIVPQAGVFTDRSGEKTYIPAMDVEGKVWTMQYIQEDGTKRFAKEARKEGCFHPVGGMDAVAAAPVLVISEGYATASTLAEATGQATIAAFDAGNLGAVARDLHAKFPDKPIIIAGDDDQHLVITQGTNPGRTKAEEAARAVGGMAIFPTFAPGESTWPAGLPAVTPERYREHERAKQRLNALAGGKAHPNEQQEAHRLAKTLLSAEQLEALDAMKSHKDFNDLGVRSVLGQHGVARQVQAALSHTKRALGQRQTQEAAVALQREPRTGVRVG